MSDNRGQALAREGDAGAKGKIMMSDNRGQALAREGDAGAKGKIMMSDNRGQALALVMILTAFIFAMGAASLSLATSLRRNAGLEICQKKAYYTAEAGIDIWLFALITLAFSI
jgi:hypothetical protein